MLSSVTRSKSTAAVKIHGIDGPVLKCGVHKNAQDRNLFWEVYDMSTQDCWLYKVHCVVLTCPKEVWRPRNDWSHLAWTQVTTVISSTLGCNYSNSCSYAHVWAGISSCQKPCGKCCGVVLHSTIYDFIGSVIASVNSVSVRSCENETKLGQRGAWLNQSKDEALKGRHESFITHSYVLSQSNFAMCYVPII